MPGPHPKTFFVRCAVAIDYRGDNDDELTYVVVGFEDVKILRRIFDWLCGNGNGLFKSYRIEHEHSVVDMQRKHYWRWAVYINEPNTRMLSPEEALLLIAARIEAEGHHTIIYRCRRRFVRYKCEVMSLKKLLNS